MINRRKGNLLPTSAFEELPDGTFIGGTSALEKDVLLILFQMDK